MNPGTDKPAIALGSPKRLAAPSPGSQRDPGQVAALLQSIANEISQSDQRQGHALADLRSRLDHMAVQIPPEPTAEEPQPAAKPAPVVAAKKPSLALPDLRPASPPKAESRAPAAATNPVPETPAGLDHIYAAVAASYSEAANRKTAKAAQAPVSQKAVRASAPVMSEDELDDAGSEFMDLSALAEPHRPSVSPAKPAPAPRAEPVAQPERPAPRPVVAASLAVEKSIGELTRRVAETEAKAEQALQRAGGSETVNVHVEALRAELEKLSSEHAKVSVEVGKVSSDVRSLSEAAGRIGPIGDTLEHLNEAILTLRKDMPGFAEAAADRASAQFAASQPPANNTAELADKLATVQSLLVAQSREYQEAGGRSFGALESIRGLVENLHSRIDALESVEPEAAPIPASAPAAPPKAEALRPAMITPEPAQAPAAPSMSREELIASARRAAMAASQKVETQQAVEAPAPAAKPLRDFLPKAPGSSLFATRGVGAIGGLAMVALLAVGSGVIVTKFLRKPAPAMTIEKVSLPAMPDDFPDAAPKDKAMPSNAKDASKPAPAMPKATDPAPAAPGKTSALVPAAQDALAASADELPKTVSAKPVAMAEATPAAAPVVASIDSLPVAIAPQSTRDAAIAGDPTAAYTIAERFLAGKGVTRNPKMAEHWYEQAAKAGSANAEFRLGALYEKGDEGVASDKAKAQIWYRKGADHGNVQAMHNLAVLYAAQTGGTPDYASSAKWFEQAAAYGLKDSQYNLAVLYQNGLGVKKDLPTAYKWFAIGAARGDTEAAKQRDDLHKILPTAVLAGLEPQIKAWRAKQPQQAAEVVPRLPTAEAEVTSVQKMLVQLGYDPGAVDGKMSAQTREAIRGFEQRSGLPDDGEITDAVLTKLRALAG